MKILLAYINYEKAIDKRYQIEKEYLNNKISILKKTFGRTYFSNGDTMSVKEITNKYNTRERFNVVYADTAIETKTMDLIVKPLAINKFHLY